MRLSITPLIIAVAMSCSIPGGAEESPYIDLERRPIKALATEQIVGYRTGAGMGFALAAELNGYPGPKHVLELVDELELTGQQRAATQQAFEEMLEAAQELGSEIIEGESRLDRLFSEGEITDADLDREVVAIAALQGRLRATHLRAHLRMKEVLSPHQVEKYRELRGYGADHDPARHQGHDPARHHPGG
jgi:Spy/CpxP family protein refolding chaperone